MVEIKEKQIKLQIWDTVRRTRTQREVFVLNFICRPGRNRSDLSLDLTTEEQLVLFWFMISQGNFILLLLIVNIKK